MFKRLAQSIWMLHFQKSRCLKVQRQPSADPRIASGILSSAALWICWSERMAVSQCPLPGPACSGSAGMVHPSPAPALSKSLASFQFPDILTSEPNLISLSSSHLTSLCLMGFVSSSRPLNRNDFQRFVFWLYDRKLVPNESWLFRSPRWQNSSRSHVKTETEQLLEEKRRPSPLRPP